MNIPFFLGTSKGNSWSDGLSVFGQLMQMIFYLVIILFMVYAVVKFFSRTAYKQNRNSNLRIIESIGINNQTVVQLLKVGSKYFLLGVTKERITLLSEISEDDVILREPEKVQFDKFLQRFMKKESTQDD